MSLIKEKMTFGRHETFSLRYGWLTKGFVALRQDTAIFTKPEEAMILLGVGKNMVSAIQYWLQVVGVATFENGKGDLTKLGHILFGDKGDPYLEDEATLWIMHWQIASNAQLATGFYWFFNIYSQPRFHTEDVLKALDEFIYHETKTHRAESTLKSDVSTLFRGYSHHEGVASDEHLDSPLAQLKLIESKGAQEGYYSPRMIRPFFPPIALHYALLVRFNEKDKPPALPIRDLIYGQHGQVAMGAIFRLSEEGFMNVLSKVVESYPKYYELRDTAGMKQIYRKKNLPTPEDALRVYYGNLEAGTIFND